MQQQTYPRPLTVRRERLVMFHPDFKELLFAFDAHKVRYLVVGGYAVSFHAQPRATKDLDLFVKPDAANAKAVYDALSQFGAPMDGFRVEDFMKPDLFFRIGTPPLMVDILPAIQGIDFDKAWENRIPVPLGTEVEPKAYFIGREDLIQAKLAVGRPQDIADAHALEAAAASTDTKRPLQKPI